MLTTAIVAFREFLEVFLIVGVFLGISKKLKLKREKEILLASAIGLFLALLLPIITFSLGDKARIILTERNADLLGGYLSVFSGFFLAYVIFSLHNFFRTRRSRSILKTHESIQNNVFDLSVFATIVFLIVREGFEVALFTATTSLFSQFLQNFLGLFIGFALSFAIGALSFFTYIRFTVGNIFRITEFAIVLLGATFVKNGITVLSELLLKIDLGKIAPLYMSFLPGRETIVGHFIFSTIGMEQEFSIAKLLLMVLYFDLIYLIFFRKRTHPNVNA